MLRVAIATRRGAIPTRRSVAQTIVAHESVSDDLNESGDIESISVKSSTKLVFGCSVVTRIACHGMRNFYIEHHFQRYKDTLSNPDYCATLNLGVEDVRLELESLQRKQGALQQCAVVGLSEVTLDLKL